MKTHKYRISNAAVGKILTQVMEMTRSSEISTAQFHDTMFAALNYIEGEIEPEPTSNINPMKWQVVKEQIDKAARRSTAARERAARRRQSLISSARTPAISDSEDTASSAAPDRSTLSLNSQRSLSALNSLPSPKASLTPEAEKAERERLERLSRQYDKVCRMTYW